LPKQRPNGHSKFRRLIWRSRAGIISVSSLTAELIQDRPRD
jgi:hypothetical protein